MRTPRRASPPRPDRRSTFGRPRCPATRRTDGPSAMAATSAAAARATPVVTNTVQRPNTASNPPMAGPTIRPDMRAPDTHPYAIPSSSGGTTSATAARSAGAAAANPSPWTNRSTTSQATDSGSTKTTEAAAESSSPATIISRRPSRSASQPAGHCPTACATNAAATITPTSAYEAPRSRRYSGRMGRMDPIPVPDTKTAARIPASAVRRRTGCMTENGTALGQPGDGPRSVDVDPGVGRLLAQAGHQLDVARQRHVEARTDGRIHRSHWQREPAWPPLQGGIVGQRQVRLRHADGQGPQAALTQPVDPPLALRQELHAVGAVQPPRQDLNLLPHRRVRPVQRSESVHPTARSDHGLRQFQRALAAAAE